MSRRLGPQSFLLASAALLLIQPAVALAAPAQRYSFDLPAQDLGEALRATAARAGWQIYAPAQAVNGRVSPPLHGTMSLPEAVDTLLAGSGLVAHFSGQTVTIRAAGTADAATQAATDAPIVVTGTRIRGAAVAAPVIQVSRADIVAAGQTDLGQALRALPQNFGGGQNPGVGAGAGGTNENVNMASSVNLRGLGADATLTLLNGHRLPYDSAYGGVDISAIPVAAVERIDVVADGSSALYGSDAVAGVVNVVLRTDYVGLATSAQIGTSTQGGDFQQQADLVTGTRWAGGGAMLAYDFAHNSAIVARQRDFAGTLSADNTLYGEQRRHAVTATLHQDLAPGLTLRLDGSYSTRASQTAGGTDASRILFRPRVTMLSLAPELTAALGRDWTARILGTWGQDHTRLSSDFDITSINPSINSGCICNRAWSAETNVEGPLFRTPGGTARLALGGGVRRNGFAYSVVSNGVTTQDYDVARSSRYAFGELNLPIIAPGNAVPGVTRLNLSAALRYEDYPGMARMTTPRLGLIYAPARAITIKASWGRSFKAPNLYQQYMGYQTYLLPGSWYGLPSGNLLLASGGNTRLTPERARTWQAGVTLEPAAVPGLRVEASYFDVQYRDRVAEPFPGSIADALSNPGNAGLVTFSPSAPALTTLVAGSRPALVNYTGAAFDPAAVAVLVDDRYVNIARQAIRGIDLRATWKKPLDDRRTLAFDLAGAWLDSDQILSAGQPQTRLAGVIFQPANLRARGGVSYEDARFSGAVHVNYIGALRDQRFATPARLSPQATADLALRYTVLPARRWGEDPGLVVSLTVNNLFDAQPPAIGQTGPTDTPFDSTNYSAIGRFIAFGLARRW